VEEATPVKALVSMNVLSGKDRFVLTREQRDQLMGMAQADVPVWVPPGCLQWSVTGQRRKRSNFIHFEVAQKTVRLSEHTTSIFIDEIIRQRRALEETTLYRIALSPNGRVWRQISSEGVKHRVRLDSEESLRAYHARCIDLAASIARHGVMPMQSQEGADWRERDGEDGDVLVAIDENGRFLHFRRGRHRMAIAQALGVERMPVLIHVMSGRYLLRFLRRWEVLVPGRLERAMRAAIAHAVAEANKRIGVILLLCAA
jgi:hypothetical protein